MRIFLVGTVLFLISILESKEIIISNSEVNPFVLVPISIGIVISILQDIKELEKE